MQHTSTAHSIIGARSGGRVERCHGLYHNGSYSNAAHSWGVAMLMHALWPEDFPRLAYHCLAHDIPEAWMGDIPAPTMRFIPGMKEVVGPIEDALMRRLNMPPINNLAEADHAKLKACDWLEFYLWTRDQDALGNQFAHEGRLEIEAYIDKMGLPSPAWEVFGALMGMSVVAGQSGVMKSVMEGLK